MNYPTSIEVNGKKYQINTDFRVAIRCEQVATDYNISNNERALAIIYLLFGEKALNDVDNYEQFLILAKKFLGCGKEIDSEENERDPDMDFVEDYDYIEASFMSDYHIDLENQKMHWWKFMKLINGLSSSEFGNCCVLNSVRNLRNYDVSQIKDEKEKNRIIKAKESVALHKKEKVFDDEQQKSMDKFNKLAHIERS